MTVKVTKFSADFSPGHYRRLSSLILLAACLLLTTTSNAQVVVDTVYTIPVNRPPLGATQSFIVSTPLSPAIPTFVAILLAGANGNIQLTPVGTSDGTLDVSSSNFLVRSRWLFAGHGFYTIALDIATDFPLPQGLTDLQGSANHITDVLQVIAWARAAQPGLPVWVIGTSRGTAGAFVAGQYSPGAGGPDGLVFTDSINNPSDPDSLVMAPLAGITVPVLFVNETGNACAGTLAGGNAAVVKKLTSSTKVSQEEIGKGNLLPLTDACHALSEHGFFGVEETAVHKIALWIESAP